MLYDVETGHELYLIIWRHLLCDKLIFLIKDQNITCLIMYPFKQSTISLRSIQGNYITMTLASRILLLYDLHSMGFDCDSSLITVEFSITYGKIIFVIIVNKMMRINHLETGSSDIWMRG